MNLRSIRKISTTQAILDDGTRIYAYAGSQPDDGSGGADGGDAGGGDAGGDPVGVEEIKRQAIREANARVNEKLVRSAVTVQAAELLRDPSDAARYIDISDYEVDDDGNVDARQIQDDLKALLRDRPYLGKARKGDGQNGGNPDFDGGTRSGTTALSMDDLIRRTAGARR